jgi:hypothetical protein
MKLYKLTDKRESALVGSTYEKDGKACDLIIEVGEVVQCDENSKQIAAWIEAGLVAEVADSKTPTGELNKTPKTK